jgi:hypothetical protein
MSEVAQPYSLQQLLTWAEDRLWRPTREVSRSQFQQICLSFYRDKTCDRLADFTSSRSIVDETLTINGTNVPAALELLERVDFKGLADAEQTFFHGDFILDNILKTKNGFCLLDWRQNFGGLLRAGDKYYDLAKLNHNLTVNHGIVNSQQFFIKVKRRVVECDIMRHQTLVQCQEELDRFMLQHNYDRRKVKLLTALIWLNMAPLHEHPLDLFLYYFGRLNLWYILCNDQ